MIKSNKKKFFKNSVMLLKPFFAVYVLTLCDTVQVCYTLSDFALFSTDI